MIFWRVETSFWIFCMDFAAEVAAVCTDCAMPLAMLAPNEPQAAASASMMIMMILLHAWLMMSSTALRTSASILPAPSSAFETALLTSERLSRLRAWVSPAAR